MLVLSRKKNESIAFYKDGKLIGTITTVSVDRDKVRIGFDFDPSTTIMRTELLGGNVPGPTMAGPDTPGRESVPDSEDIG